MSDAAQWTAEVLKGNGGIRDDGHWHAEHCPGVPSYLCHCVLIENEMADFFMVMRHCAEIYDEASGGRVSKPTTLPSVVIDFMREQRLHDINEATEEIRAALRHAITRTHPFNPAACSACEEAEALAESEVRA